MSHKFNSDTIKDVGKIYQGLVEYYSSIGMPYYEIYLQKISNLYARADVKLILGISG
jgi:hypothetical protein